MGKYKKLSHVIYKCGYHIVWVPKYRFGILKGAVGELVTADIRVQSGTEQYTVLLAAKGPDTEHGGFLGRIDHIGKTIPESPKGIILNSRILWAFSAASNHFGDSRYKRPSERAYSYLLAHFKDVSSGGVFWELDCLGNPTIRRKQVYAQAFTMYALAEYYKCCGRQEVLTWAMELFHLVENHALDPDFEGYTEAFAENWEPIKDMRLSEKDVNAPPRP